MTDDEKKLLDFVYKQGEELERFLKENDYSIAYRSIGYWIGRTGYLNASLSVDDAEKTVRICDKDRICGYPPEYKEHKYKENE